MRVYDLQPTLKTIVTALPSLSTVVANIYADDGTFDFAMTESLANVGIVILIMLPQAMKAHDEGRRVVVLPYSTTIWLRTNPKFKSGSPPVAVWNPLTIEDAIITAVLANNFPNLGQQPFRITPEMEPETDWSDIGNNSRLIRFSSLVTYGTNATG